MIYGLRRVGKTVLMYQLIDHLLKSGIDKKHIFYFTFDEKIASLKELLEEYAGLVLGKDILTARKIYVFLD
ncbi:MAG: AAA family ATPase, partial [Thermodesulfobacteria bacterium]|nr:AAA family ATPase [Thermodesulfobacteriota bacterium]